MKNDLKEALEMIREMLERGRGAEWLAVTQMELSAIRVLVDRVIGADPPTLPDKKPSLQPAGDTPASERAYGNPFPPPPPPPPTIADPPPFPETADE